MQYEKSDYNEVLRLAEEQSVVGLVAAGFEHVADFKPPQNILLQFVGEALQLEQRNREMNEFIAKLVEKMRNADIYGLLVKGSGVAQCYERPLWRSCGDIDFFFSRDNYNKAKDLFLKLPNATQFQNSQYTKSYGVTIEPWAIELHGSLRNGLSSKMDHCIDDVQKDIFYGGNVRSWKNGETIVFLPSPDNDVFLVFVHFVKHLYKEGINLRQVCDWCRLLWAYRDSLNHELLRLRIKKNWLNVRMESFCYTSDRVPGNAGRGDAFI